MGGGGGLELCIRKLGHSSNKFYSKKSTLKFLFFFESCYRKEITF